MKHVKKITFSMRASCFYIKSDMSTFRESPPTILRLNNNTTVNMAARSFTCQLMHKISHLHTNLLQKFHLILKFLPATCRQNFESPTVTQILLPGRWCIKISYPPADPQNLLHVILTIFYLSAVSQKIFTSQLISKFKH